MALGAGKGRLREEGKGGGGGLREEGKGGDGILRQERKGGGGNSRGLGVSLADADRREDGLLEEGNGGCGGRQLPHIPDPHGVLILGPNAASSTGDGAAPRPPIKFDFNRKGKNVARFPQAKDSPECSTSSRVKATACGLGTHIGLFKGYRVLPLGFKKSSQEEVSEKIRALGGIVAAVGEYETCTHICLGNEVDKRLITEDWVNLCYDGDNVRETEGNAMVTSVDSKRRRATFNLNPDNRIIRELFPESSVGIDEQQVRRVHHNLFQCMSDESNLITFAAYAKENRKSLIISDKCPGTNRDGSHTSTLLELKHMCRDIYLLLKSLKKAGYTLGGNFTAKNFVVTKRVFGKGILFGNLEKDSLQLTSANGESCDEKSFKRMIHGLFPKPMLPPHDIVTWLALVGQKDLEGLLISNWTLLEQQDARERFLYLSGKLIDLMKSKDKRTIELCDRIFQRLEQKGGYDKWQDIIDGPNGNAYLKKTLGRHNPETKIYEGYGESVSGLLKLLRNCRHHYAKPEVEKFLMIIADNFPNLVTDFQEVMYQEGFFA